MVVWDSSVSKLTDYGLITNVQSLGGAEVCSLYPDWLRDLTSLISHAYLDFCPIEVECESDHLWLGLRLHKVLQSRMLKSDNLISLVQCNMEKCMSK